MAGTVSLRNAGRMLATLWGNGVKSGKVDRSNLQQMIFPYTLTAKQIQFDWIYMYKQCWWPRYWLYANILCYPLWVWIHFKGEYCSSRECN